MQHAATLYLIPVPITDGGEAALSTEVKEMACALRNFIAEDAKTARRHLKAMGYVDLSKAEILLLNEHTGKADLAALLKPLLDGNDVGLMSDAGCPGIADPGAEVVRLAHSRGIPVRPLAGPSSIMLSVMASGMNGQNFAFNGYLPVDKGARDKRLRELESVAAKSGQAQFLIETPYRSEQIFAAMLEVLNPATLMFVGAELGHPSQTIITRTVAAWRSAGSPGLHKRPAVFGIYRQ